MCHCAELSGYTTPLPIEFTTENLPAQDQYSPQGSSINGSWLLEELDGPIIVRPSFSKPRYWYRVGGMCFISKGRWHIKVETLRTYIWLTQLNFSWRNYGWWGQQLSSHLVCVWSSPFSTTFLLYFPVSCVIPETICHTPTNARVALCDEYEKERDRR